jgi:hypothetical protein
VTRLTKDLETRIREIEDVQIDIWHWYYESLVGLGGLWFAWLLGLIFLRRSGNQSPAATEDFTPPTFRQRIEYYLEQMGQRALDVRERAELEVLLIRYWKDQRGWTERLSETCRRLQADPDIGSAYAALQQWLHTPHSEDVLGGDPCSADAALRVRELCRPDRVPHDCAGQEQP